MKVNKYQSGSVVSNRPVSKYRQWLEEPNPYTFDQYANRPHAFNRGTWYPDLDETFNWYFKAPYQQHVSNRSEDAQEAIDASNERSKKAYKIKDKTESSSQFNDEKEWLWWWYNNPATQEIVKKDSDLMSGTLYDKGAEYEPMPDMFPGYTSHRTIVISEDPSERLQYLLDKGLSVPILSDPSLNSEDYGGYFHGNDYEWYPGYIQLNTDNNNDSYLKAAALHELNHSIQNTLIPNYIESHDIPYFERKHEIQSYIMNIRRELGLDPNKRDYTEKDAYKIYHSAVNSSGANSRSTNAWFNYMLKTYGSKFYSKLADWLNTLADADVKSDRRLKDADQYQDLNTWKDHIASAKNGGTVNYLEYLNYKIK